MFLFFRSKTVGSSKLMQPDSPRNSAQSGRYALTAADSLRIRDYHPAGRSKIWNKTKMITT